MYLHAQREDREKVRASYQAMRKLGGTKGYKLPAHTIDRISTWSVEDFALEFYKVLAGRSEYPAAVREYVEQLGKQAYNVTIAQIICEEFPELNEELFPKAS
jgi:hypothetical protein